MKIETGTPIIEGRYLVYVDGLAGWCEPKILTWRKGAWHYYHSTQQLQETAHGWIGPLPILEIPKPPVQMGVQIVKAIMAETENLPVQEFDL